MAYLASTINTSAVIAEQVGTTATTDVRGLAMKFDSNGNVVPAGAGEASIGVALMTNDETVAAGNDLTIQYYGIGRVLAGAAFSKGDQLSVDANGKYVKTTSGATVVAVALQAAPAAGAFIEAILK